MKKIEKKKSCCELIIWSIGISLIVGLSIVPIYNLIENASNPSSGDCLLDKDRAYVARVHTIIDSDTVQYTYYALRDDGSIDTGEMTRGVNGFNGMYSIADKQSTSCTLAEQLYKTKEQMKLLPNVLYAGECLVRDGDNDTVAKIEKIENERVHYIYVDVVQGKIKNDREINDFFSMYKKNDANCFRFEEIKDKL